MGDEYKPPFTITELATNLVIEIGELVGRITEKENLTKMETAFCLASYRDINT